MQKHLILGYHGTSIAAANKILKEGFRATIKPYHWLGDGVYFFQDAPGLAQRWSKFKMEELQKRREKIVVFAASIDLTDCMDLLDATWFPFLKRAYDGVRYECNQMGKCMPVQKGVIDEQLAGQSGKHELDCSVINHAVDRLETRNIYIRSVRAVFIEGHPVYDTSHFVDGSNVSIAVRDTSVIKTLELIDLS